MYTILWGNGPETDYSRCLAQHNPSLKEKLSVRQDTQRQTQKEDKPTAKEIAEAFSTMIGQEICEEEVSLIQGIQLPDKEDSNLTKDTVHNPISRNCAITVLTVKPHIITSTELYRQGIAPRSQYSDLVLEAATLH